MAPKIVPQDEPGSPSGTTTHGRRPPIVVVMRKRLYLALIVLAVLLLALGGLVVRSTASGIRAATGS